MPRVVCFGEIMLRLNAHDHLKILQSNDFKVSYAGSEANVAVSLSNFDISVEMVTKLPKNQLGQAAVNELRKYGIMTDGIVRDDNRLGIYFIEMGASQRPSNVIYDRKNSSIALAEVDDFDWGKIFFNTDWFHFSGITPALSDKLAKICLKACKTAKTKGIKVSCDLNYRSNLWGDKSASLVMTELMEYVDVLIGNEEDAEKIFGIIVDDNYLNKYKNINTNSYKTITKLLMEKFDFDYVALTLRESISADRNLWSGILYDGKNHYISKKYDINIVDRLGGGDSFAAGIIYSIIKKFTHENIIDFAVGASCLKHTMHYDFNLATVEEVQSLIVGDDSGRIRR